MKTVIWAVLAAVLAGALGFYGGVTYQKAQGPAALAGRAGGPRGGGGFGQGGQGAPGVPGGAAGAGGQRGFGRQAGSVTTGTILAQDAKSITVKTADGGSKTVFISANTRLSEQKQLTAADLKVGDQIFATGQPASGGIDARSINLVPPGSDFRFGGPGDGAPPAGGF
jgi:hypothetical protein